MPTDFIRLASSVAAGLVYQQGAPEGTPGWVFLCGLFIAIMVMAVVTFIRERRKRR